MANFEWRQEKRVKRVSQKTKAHILKLRALRWKIQTATSSGGPVTLTEEERLLCWYVLDAAEFEYLNGFKHVCGAMHKPYGECRQCGAKYFPKNLGRRKRGTT